MSQKYSTIPAGDFEADGDVHGIALHAFELEDSHSIRRDRPKSYSLIISLFALLVVMVGYGVHKGDGKRGSSPQAPITNHNGENGPDVEKSMQEGKIKQPADESLVASATPTDAPTPIPPKIIFSYGDSLTYGMVPHSEEPCPYAQFLEQELNTLSDSASASASTTVEHLGLPGWTATTMLNRINADDDGICSILHRLPTLSLMIILVGTNDIGEMTNAGKAVSRSIVESIVDLHQGAFSCAEAEGNDKFRTLAVGIPGSEFQEKVHSASDASSYVNGALKEFAAESNGKVSYVEFPFPYQKLGRKWGDDGLHLTEEGYEALGKDLAPFVKVILENDGS